MKRASNVMTQFKSKWGMGGLFICKNKMTRGESFGEKRGDNSLAKG